jgi:glutaminyl-peptide cyclotransferase
LKLRETMGLLKLVTAKTMQFLLVASLILASLTGCKAKENNSPLATATSPAASRSAGEPANVAGNDAPPPSATGGFDGQRAYAQVAKQVAFGPRPSGSPAISQLQDYLLAELKSYGCAVETQAFTADTPVGRLPMKNILVKIPGDKPQVLLLGTHYDTKLQDNFVGANDAGSSTAVMLELARLLCPHHGRYAVWIAFFDGEEAIRTWTETDSRYGSREMAAHFANTGDISKIKAFLLADIVGGSPLHFKRDGNSTPALIDLVWKTATKLGYAGIFVNDEAPIDDDHMPFIKRKVPSVDVIDLDTAQDVPYWHTAQDTLDKISAKSLAITGHVFLESLKQLQSK